jgi:hypothetical protein
MNYGIFDPFLAGDRWHIPHPLEDRAFYRCLQEIVELPEFAPEALGDYIRRAKAVDTENHPLSQRVRDLVRNARAVREYLAANRLPERKTKKRRLIPSPK